MNYIFELAYDGTEFFGFQRQSQKRSVQGELESFLSIIFNEKIELVAAGRTDRGVHAEGQVVAFQSEKVRELEKIVAAINSKRAGLALCRASILKEEVAFHPRYDARSRTYHYRLLTGADTKAQVLAAHRMACLASPLDTTRINEGAQELLGSHDFRSFSSRCDLPDTRRQLLNLKIEDAGKFMDGQLLLFHVEANGFLRRMVRLLVGALVELGLGSIDRAELLAMLEAKDPSVAPHPAPAEGLYFHRVDYHRDPFSLDDLAKVVYSAPRSQNFRFKRR